MTGGDYEASELSPEGHAAMDALDAGHPREALAEAARIEDAAERAHIEAQAFLELGMLEAAGGALERLAAEVGEESPDVQELLAEVCVAGWDFEGARAALERAIEAEGGSGSAALQTLLGLVLDHLGEDEAALRARTRAHDLDPAACPPPVRLDEARFDHIVETTLAGLPATFRKALDQTRIVREPLPHRGLELEPGSVPPDLLGLFAGPTIHDGLGEISGELPPTIHLFQRNIERISGSEEEAAREVRTTLLHEIGHLLGLDEDEVAAMGLA